MGIFGNRQANWKNSEMNLGYHIRMDVNPPTEYDRFTSLVDRVLSVPKAEIQRREQEYKRETALRPKRGPKPKTASRDSGA